MIASPRRPGGVVLIGALAGLGGALCWTLASSLWRRLPTALSAGQLNLLKNLLALLTLAPWLLRPVPEMRSLALLAHERGAWHRCGGQPLLRGLEAPGDPPHPHPRCGGSGGDRSVGPRLARGGAEPAAVARRRLDHRRPLGGGGSALPRGEPGSLGCAAGSRGAALRERRCPVGQGCTAGLRC